MTEARARYVAEAYKEDIEVIRIAAESLRQAKTDEEFATRLSQYTDVRTKLAPIDGHDQRESMAKGQDGSFLNIARVMAIVLLIAALTWVAVLGITSTDKGVAAAPYVSLLSGLVGIGLGWLFGNVERSNSTDASQQTRRGAKRQRKKENSLGE